MNIDSKNETVFIGIEEASEIAGIGRNSMLNLVKRDDFPAIKLGKRKIYINKQQFLEWLNSLTKAF